MAETKTKQTQESVDAFLEKVTDENARQDSQTLIKIMKRVTGQPPKMWGSSIIGFGQYHYKYDSGHEGDICLTGFSPRKANLSLYVLSPDKGQEALLKKLGKHRAGKGCLYIKKLDDVDLAVLEALITNTIDWIRKKYPGK